MKRLSSLIPILALVLVFSSDALGQAGSVDVTATATIVSALNTNVDSDLNFGEIPSNFSGVSISPDASGDGNFTESNTGSGSSLGQVTIDTGGNQQTIYLTVNNPTTLTSSSTPTNIGFNADYVGEEGTDLSSASSEEVTTDDDNTNGTYDFVIYLGGNLDDPGTNDSESSFDSEPHTGTITINIDFSS